MMDPGILLKELKNLYTRSSIKLYKLPIRIPGGAESWFT